LITILQLVLDQFFKLTMRVMFVLFPPINKFFIKISSISNIFFILQSLIVPLNSVMLIILLISDFVIVLMIFHFTQSYSYIYLFFILKA